MRAKPAEGLRAYAGLGIKPYAGASNRYPGLIYPGDFPNGDC